MLKNVVKPVMLSSCFAFFTVSCSTVNYRPPLPQGNKSGYLEASNKTSKEQKLRDEITSYAKTYIGASYKYSGKNPKGFDCSGFTGYVFDKFDIELSASSQAQATTGKKIPLSQAQSGDLLFFGKRGKINHVALVLSNSSKGIEVIHSTSSRGVLVENVSQSDYWKPRILFARDVIP
jgi:cell wall-associated NlpC family hydrolase